MIRSFTFLSSDAHNTGRQPRLMQRLQPALMLRSPRNALVLPASVACVTPERRFGDRGPVFKFFPRLQFGAREGHAKTDLEHTRAAWYHAGRPEAQHCG